MPEPTTLTIGAAGISSLIGAVWSIAKSFARIEALEKRIESLEERLGEHQRESASLLRSMSDELTAQRILIERISARLEASPRPLSDAPTGPITVR